MEVRNDELIKSVFLEHKVLLDNKDYKEHKIAYQLQFHTVISICILVQM